MTKIEGPKDVLILFIFTLDWNLVVISNDEYTAKDLLVKFLFADRESFNSRVKDLTIFEEWSDDQRIKGAFISELESQRPLDNPTDAN